MEFRDYVTLLKRRWWVLLLCLVLGGVGAQVATSRQAKTYGSQVTFFLSDANGRPVSTLIAASAQTRFSSYSTLVASQPLTLLVRKQVGLGAPGWGVSATGVPSTIFFRLTTTAHDPAFAYRVAKAYATAFPAYISTFEGTSNGDGNTLRVLEPAGYDPTLLGPNRSRNITVGVGLGLVIGLGLLLLLEALDNKVRDVGELEELAGVGVAASVPVEFRKLSLVVDNKPRSQRAEAIRLIRTNVQFAGIGDAMRTLVVTSPGAGEGKTSVATDLAVAYAQAGQRVILVDADLRKPRVGASFSLEDEPGLTGVLVGQVSLADALRPWREGVLRVLTSGARPSNPSELLASSKMAELLQVLRDDADLVIIDSAPVMPVADTTGLVAHADAVLLVVRLRSTSRSAVTSTITRLQSVNARVVGLVANGGRTESDDGYYGPSERRGFLRRSQSVELLDVPVDAVQSPALSPAAPGPQVPMPPPQVVTSLGARSTRDKQRPAEPTGDGRTSFFVNAPEGSAAQRPPAGGQA